MTALKDDADFERLIVDESHIKVYPGATGTRDGHHAMYVQKVVSNKYCFKEKVPVNSFKEKSRARRVFKKRFVRRLK